MSTKKKKLTEAQLAALHYIMENKPEGKTFSIGKLSKHFNTTKGVMRRAMSKIFIFPSRKEEIKIEGATMDIDI